jgi:cysteine-S-conjugate beta-lyase
MKFIPNLLLDGNKFTPMAKLSREIEQHVITLDCAVEDFQCCRSVLRICHHPKQGTARTLQGVESSAFACCQPGTARLATAYSGKCDGWLAELNPLSHRNRDFLVDYVTKYMPNVRTTIPDATYLGWLDFTQAGIDGSPFEFFKEKAKVASVKAKYSARKAQVTCASISAHRGRS